MEKITQVITAKFKLELTKEQQQEVLNTIKVFSTSLNDCLQQNFESKTINRKFLHDTHYKRLRTIFPSQMAINIYRETSTIYSNLLKKQKKIKNKQKRKEFFKKPPQRSSPVCQYTMNRDFSINVENHTVSFRTLDSRLKNIKFFGWNQHYDMLKQGKMCDPRIKYDRSNKCFFLLLPIEIEISEKNPNQIVGVDRGERHVAATVSTTGVEKIYDVQENHRSRKNVLHDLRGRLASKGTRSARRKAARLSRREQRLTKDCLHCIATKMISDHPKARFVLEDLTGIRENRNTWRKTDEQRRHAEQWSFAELEEILSYKSVLHNGISIAHVNPSYTSQTCPVCGHCEEGNRMGDSFVCLLCSFGHHADLVGGRNILSKFQGQFVILPKAQKIEEFYSSYTS